MHGLSRTNDPSAGMIGYAAPILSALVAAIIVFTGLVAVPAHADEDLTADSDTSERGLEVTDEDSDETPVLTGSTPVITGTYQVGSTLVVEPGAWEPAEVELSYRWLRDGQVIPWATGDSFSLQAVDENRDITVEVTGHFGTSQVTKTSTPVTVEPGTLTIGMPKIQGTPMGGETLSVDPGEWGPGTVHFFYQWYRNGSAIRSATDSTYQLPPESFGSYSVEVEGARDGYNWASARSNSVLVRSVSVSGGREVLTTADQPMRFEVHIMGLTSGETPNLPTMTMAGKAVPLRCGAYSLYGASAAISCESSQPAKLGTTQAQFSVTIPGDDQVYSVSQELLAEGALDPCFEGGSRDTSTGRWIDPTRLCWDFADAFRDRLPQGPYSYQIMFAPLEADGDTVNYDSVVWFNYTSPTFAPVKLDPKKDLFFLPNGTYETIVQIFSPDAEIGFWREESSNGAYLDYGPITLAHGQSDPPTPVIDGAPKVGSYLGVSAGTWPSHTTFTYRWYRDDTYVGQGHSYQVRLADAGSKLSVTVAGKINGFGTFTSKQSQSVLVPLQSLKSSTPAISGKVKTGSTLTASAGTWTSGTTLKYQWYRGDKAIKGATKSTYKLLSADSGKSITVKVTGSKTGYDKVTKSATAKWTLKKATPKITGTKTVGKTLTAKAGTWTKSTKFTYQWLRDGKAISGATKSTYKLTAKDAGTRISVKVTGKKSGYNTASKTSAKTAKVAKATLKTAKPTISGTKKVGKTLTAKTGTWTSGTKFTYQWLRNGKAISGATKSTYRLVSADGGKQISVKVTGKKSGYATKSKTSAKTSTVKYPSKTAPVSTKECPSWAPVKGNHSSSGELIYHVKGGQFYNKTNPEECFTTESAAEKAGYRKSLR